MAVANTNFVMFYDAASGYGVVGHFDNAGVFHEDWHSSQFSPGWTHVVSTWQGDLLFYRKDTGASVSGALNSDGSFVSKAPIHGMTPKWDSIVPAGVRGLFFYRFVDGFGAFGELGSNGFRTIANQSYQSGWTVIPASNGSVLFYDDQTGEGIMGGFQNGRFLQLRAYVPDSFLLGWELVTSIGSLF